MPPVLWIVPDDVLWRVPGRISKYNLSPAVPNVPIKHHWNGLCYLHLTTHLGSTHGPYEEEFSICFEENCFFSGWHSFCFVCRTWNPLHSPPGGHQHPTRCGPHPTLSHPYPRPNPNLLHSASKTCRPQKYSSNKDKMWLAGSSDRPIPVTLLMSRSWYWGPSENQMILVLPIFVSGELKHFHHHPHSGGDGRTICIQIQPVFSPANVLSLRALQHESILWEVYHQKKPHLFIPFLLKDRICEKFSGRKVNIGNLPPAPCFFNPTFQTEEFIMRRRRGPFVFVFPLSLRKCCLFLTLSFHPTKLALLRQSLYVLGDQEWKMLRTNLL